MKIIFGEKREEVLRSLKGISRGLSSVRNRIKDRPEDVDILFYMLQLEVLNLAKCTCGVSGAEEVFDVMDIRKNSTH